MYGFFFFFFFQAEDGIRDGTVTGVQTCALPISDKGQTQRQGGFALHENSQITITRARSGEQASGPAPCRQVWLAHKTSFRPPAHLTIPIPATDRTFSAPWALFQHCANTDSAHGCVVGTMCGACNRS